MPYWTAFFCSSDRFSKPTSVMMLKVCLASLWRAFFWIIGMSVAANIPTIRITVNNSMIVKAFLLVFMSVSFREMWGCCLLVDWRR